MAINNRTSSSIRFVITGPFDWIYGYEFCSWDNIFAWNYYPRKNTLVILCAQHDIKTVDFFVSACVNSKIGPKNSTVKFPYPTETAQMTSNEGAHELITIFDIQLRRCPTEAAQVKLLRREKKKANFSEIKINIFLLFNLSLTPRQFLQNLKLIILFWFQSRFFWDHRQHPILWKSLRKINFTDSSVERKYYFQILVQIPISNV